MKTLLHLAASTALSLSLSMGAVAFGQHYNQTNLVSNVSGAAHFTDSKLVNPWGLSRGPSGDWWVNDELTGFATLYNGSGTKNSLAVSIPPADPTNKKTPIGSPTGIVANNSTTDFSLPVVGFNPEFIFSTIDGSIAIYNPHISAGGSAQPSTQAVTVVTNTDGSSYTGLTSAFIGTKRYLYAANFTKGRVDVYDQKFQHVNLQGVKDPFQDPELPADFVPFNVQAIGNDIVVTYVLHEPGAQFETDGPGMGRVDIYNSDGLLLQRLQHGDYMNAPWGVALAPLDFGRFSHDLLVAQFAGGGTTENSGVIAAFDLVTGQFDGLLQDASGKTLTVPGIWAISPGNVAPDNSDAAASPAAQLYFTAVPTNNGAQGGLFGYLTAVSTELAQGNGQ
jgi:uncharacterized protein (TIGR03118 family)